MFSLTNTIDKKPLNDEDIEKFVDQQKNTNTKRKTESDLRKWCQWSEEHGETRELKDIPPVELDRLLSHFFVTVRKNDGSLYEPDTLSSFQRSIDRHLTQQKKSFSTDDHQRSAVCIIAGGTQGIQETLEKGGERQQTQRS
jgi:hypothetical protein